MNPISDLGPKDEEALTRFFLENDRPEITDSFRAFPMDATSAARICHGPRRDRYFAMYEGEEIVCFGMLRGWDEGYEVPTFGLTADHRSNGRGHGWRMWRWAIGLARDLGAKKLRITTDLKNTIILGMAAKLDFKQTRELPDERVEMIADL